MNLNITPEANLIEILWALIGLGCLIVSLINLRESWKNRAAARSSRVPVADSPAFRLTANLAVSREFGFSLIQLALTTGAVRSLFYRSASTIITWDTWLIIGLYVLTQLVIAGVSVVSMRGQKKLVNMYRTTRATIKRERR